MLGVDHTSLKVNVRHHLFFYLTLSQAIAPYGTQTNTLTL